MLSSIVWELALKYCFFKLSYVLAIHLCEDSVDEATLAICLKNRAAVHLKEEDYESVVSDCTRYFDKSSSIFDV